MSVIQTRTFRQRLRVTLGAVATAGGTAALVLAGVPALASTHAASAKTTTGPEVLSGAVHGKAANVNTTRIPLTYRGVVNTHGVVTLGGGNVHKGSVKTVTSRAGKLTIRVSDKPQTSQTFSSKTCKFTETLDLTYNVVGSKSTGAFAHSSGPGAVQVYFAAFAPRYKSGPKKGKCNTSNNAKPRNKGAVASFLASTVLTVR
jgi:hypothetical protein